MKDLPKTWPLLNYPEWHNQPLNLTIEELKDPFSVISAFFDCYKLSEARICLQQWLEDALQRKDVDVRNIFALHNNIVRLAEAAWLILQQQPSLSLVSEKHDGPNIDAALRLIVAAVNPERVFLLGLNPMDLLIIMPDKAQRNFKEYENLIEFALLNQEAITFSVLRSADLLKQLQTGHLFYSFACISTNIVYDNGTPSNLPPIPDNLTELKTVAVLKFEPRFKRAESFLDGAKYHYERHEREIAAFMLQQAAELAFRALILAFTGQDIRTHEISVLRRHCNRCAPQLMEIFAKENESDSQLLRLLDKAYKNARYNLDYEISDNQIELLIRKVMLLQQKIKEAFNEKIKGC